MYAPPMQRGTAAIVVTVMFGASLGCVRATDGRSEPAPVASDPPSSPAPSASMSASVDPAQAASLASIAASYATRFQRVSPHLHVAPTLCASPRPPSSLRLSQSDDGSTHGKKVYYLYAAHDAPYVDGGGRAGTSQPADQVLVKEAWTAVAPDDPAAHGATSPTRTGRPIGQANAAVSS